MTEAVNDTLKAIAASLLMEQVLAPRFEFRPKNPNNRPTPGLDYGPGGYDPDKNNVGVNPQTGLIELEIKGLAEPKSQEAERICREDLTELVTAFVQDKQAIERGLFDRELPPEELKRGLLDRPDPSLTRSGYQAEEPSDEVLLASLGVDASAESDVARLVHVRSREEIKAAEEIAKRTPCNDFEEFKPVFERVQHDLETGKRQTVKYKKEAEFRKGDLYILDGQKVLVAGLGERFVSDYGRPDRRLRVVYDNGTESDLLARSLQRALYKDEAGRRITEPGFGPLFSEVEAEDDLATGYIYVLRSKSEHPFVVEHREVIHKIGVTGGDVKSRVAGARKDPTYLLADVDIAAIYKLANVNRTKLEALLHKVFASARLDLELKDRFGSQVEPKEWFLVPLPVIDEAIERIKDGTIGGFRYDPETARLTRW